MRPNFLARSATDHGRFRMTVAFCKFPTMGVTNGG